MENTNKDLLIDRIAGNYLSFKQSLRGVSRAKLFDMAGHIAAVSETYEQLMEDDWIDQGTAEFFLMFRDPLTVIADAWEGRKNEMIADFYDAVRVAMAADQTISQYPLMEGVGDSLVYFGDSADDTPRYPADI